MRRNGGMGWRETRKGLTSFRSLLALSPLCSYPRFFLSLSLFLSLCSPSNLSRQHTLSFLCALCLSALALYLFSLYLSLSPSSRIPCSPFFSFEHALHAAPVSTSYCLYLSSSSSSSSVLSAIYYSSARKIYIRLSRHT